MVVRTKVPLKYKNPDASSHLTLAVDVIENTPIEEINGNVIEHSKVYKNWLQAQDEHDRPAVLIAGGASINDHVRHIQKLQRDGADVFAMNGASKWARENGIEVDYQIILDAKEETASLVDQFAGEHLFSIR